MTDERRKHKLAWKPELWLGENGGDRGDLKRLGGWKSDQMVDRYGASAVDERAQADYRKRSFG